MSAIVRLAGVLMLLIAALPSHAQNTVPSPRPLEALVKSSLLSFNDANVTGNYAVFHAKLSKPFRLDFPPEKLREAFTDFMEKRIDLDIVSAMPPLYAQTPALDPDGKLLLKGHFATEPTRVSFELDFIPSDGEWKLLRIHVTLAAAP